VVVKKKVAARKPRGKRVTAREPKRIIRRKKVTSRKKVVASKRPAKKVVAKKTRATKTVDKMAKAEANADKVVALVDTKGMSMADAAAKLGIAPALAKRLYLKATTNPTDRIVGTDKELGKKIAALRDKENVAWPKIRARSGLAPGKMRQLYEEATGKDWRDSGTRGADAPRKGRPSGTKTTRKAAAKKTVGRAARPKKTAARKAGAKSNGQPRAAGRATKAKRTAKVKATAAPSGQTKSGRLARIKAEMNEKLETLWDSDQQDLATHKELLEGHTITVTRDVDGRKLKPTDHDVLTVKKVGISNREGKIFMFMDEARQTRTVGSREVTAIRLTH
jgi:hypothetical protein